MKSIINKSLITLACLPFFAQAQIDRSTPPKPLPAGVIKITDPATFVLPNGLKVFVVTSKKLPKVSATLTLDIGAIKEGDKAGYVDLAGQMMMRGTKSKSKADLDEAIDLLGADVSAGSNSVYGSSLTINFDKVMELMADITFNPLFKAEELEKIRKQTLSGLEQQKESPDAIASNVSKALAYGLNHPYGEIETEETVKKITIDDVKKYYNTYWKPNIGYLVFVGDITTEKAKQLATKHFGKWAKGVVPKTIIPFPSVAKKTIIAIVDRPQSVQSNISIIAPIALKPGEPNVIPASITASILGGGASGRLYKNLRETHGFTYGAYSSISSDRHIGTFTAGASVRNEKTDSSIGEFFNEFNRICKQPVGEDEVFMVKKELAGSFSRSLERAGTIADFALNIARNNMPKDYYKNYIKNIENVNVATVQQIANQFIKPNNLIVVVVCNAKQVAPGLEKYGDVQYFDMNGNPTKAPAKGKAVDASVSAKSIIENAIKAQGGENVISSIKDVVWSGSMDIPGAPFKPDVKTSIINGKSFLRNTSAMNGAMILQKQSVINGVYKEEGQMAAGKEMDDEDKEELDEETLIVNEIYYLKNNYNFNVKSIESVDGKDAYEVEITSKKGRKFTNFYDVATGLKVKTIANAEGPNGATIQIPTFFKDYKTYEGLQLPTKILISQMGTNLVINVNEVKVNTGLKDTDFK